VADLTPALSNYRFIPGGLALLFTDGVVEQTNRLGAEYSPNRLWGLLKEHHGKSPAEMKDILSADFDAFRGTQPQSDDVTFMIFKFT
jgi:serine phosphatase RsbU (regulator of sigma subunit)